MKNLFTGILFMIFVGVNAQAQQNCITPISNYAFQQKLTTINAQRGDDQRLPVATKIAKDNCLSTNQVKEIAVLFENDYNRLAFVQEAYLNTTDKDNFYEVYNSFLYFSTVFRLHDYITGIKNGSTTTNNYQVNNVMTFPDYQYPDIRKYYGKTGCKDIIADNDFLALANKVFTSNSEETKLYVAKGIVQNKCLLTAQAMKMASLLSNESNRLDLMKTAYNRVYDPDNYKYADQLFKNEINKNELATFTDGTNIVVNNNPPCETTTAEFQLIKTQINKESFNNTKINIAKQAIKNKKCFKTDQVKEILGLFPYSSSKLDIAKFAYEFTTDKENYYKLADSFSFTADKDEFLRFLKEK
jgi:hypothetical protein